MKVLAFLFPYSNYSASMSMVLLLLRLLFGGLMLWHGITKIQNFEALVGDFPIPLGLGHRVSLFLAIFAEVFCAAAVILGMFFRLALLPLIFSMAVAFLIEHHGQVFAAKELAMIYLVVYVILFFTGPGRFSQDNIIAVRLYEERTAIANAIVEEATARRLQGNEHQPGGEPHQ